jgi:hypothetical protein
MIGPRCDVPSARDPAYLLSTVRARTPWRRSIRIQKRKRQTNAATQAMIANTTAVVNALPLPPAFRACSILVIEIFSLVMRECRPLNPGKNPSFLLLVEV